MLALPLFKNRRVGVSFLGGVASLLVRLLDSKLITPDEYSKAKQRIFNS